MNEHITNEKYIFTDLEWDSNFFGVTCGKLTLLNQINEEDWSSINEKINEYEFVVIKNVNSNYKNSRILGENTKSFLIDINVQFKKKIDEDISEDKFFIMEKESDLIDQLFTIAKFNQSRFIEDERLLSLGGSKVYTEWIKNSFDSANKNIIFIKNDFEVVLGFVLVSKSQNQLVIELIAVNGEEKSKGIGTALIKSAESYATKNNLEQIIVGTQITNLAAMNFYNKMNFKQFEVHQVFHMWNAKKEVEI